MGAVRAAEERGSLTSLPDLIRRATRLASLIDKGTRPGSRFDDLSGWGSEHTRSRDGDASLSDMLAAFPPPVHSPPNHSRGRDSWSQSGSWPSQPRGLYSSHSRSPSLQIDGGGRKPSRRCCGLPLWAVVLIAIVILIIVAAAIILPLEFLVFKNLGNKGGRGPPEQSIENCQAFLTCLNGGINVVSPGTCSCLCTNGFTGSDCGVAGSQGCATTTLVAADESSSTSNVTLGQAIPRLVAGADSNFSVPLSGTTLLAKLNAGSLSCNAQNALVNFEGRSTRASQTSDGIAEDGLSTNALLNAQEKGRNDDEFFPVLPTIILIPPRPRTTYTTRPRPVTTIFPKEPVPIASPQPTATDSVPTTRPRPTWTSAKTTQSRTTTTPSIPAPTPSDTVPPTSSPTPPTSSPGPVPVNPFVITEDVLDFARVSVLFVAQEQTLDAAETAQAELRRFFSSASKNQADQQTASALSIGGENRINLINFSVDLGQGPVGKKNF